jgi:MtN3 and saliva related transmembrane protein
MKLYEKYMSIIGPLGNLMFFIQAYKIFRTHSAVSISLLAFGISTIGLTSWLIYGFLLKNKPLIWANLVGVTGASCVLIGTLLYA